MERKSFYREGSFNSQVIMGILAAAMIGVSIYLTSHYFQVKFPTDINSGTGLCNINAFFNCDTTTNSPFSNIAGVPISVFGVLMGVFIFAGFLFKNDETEGTNYLLLMVNAGGCLVLLLYSIFVLGGICPMCSAYYVLSWIAAYMFYKGSNVKSIGAKAIGSYAIIGLLTSGIMFYNVQQKESLNNKIATNLLSQYWGLPNLGNPATDSDYRIASATEKFSDAPIQVTYYSDFQCPACKALSDNTHKILHRYKGKLNIQYMFYPLDHNCNPAMKRPLHPLACQGAYLAACLPKKFGKVHDDIFNKQQELTLDWLKAYAKREGVTECMEDPKTKKKVQDMISAAGAFNIRSTPTMLVNGVKIEGVLPLNQLYIIFDDLLKKAK